MSVMWVTFQITQTEYWKHQHIYGFSYTTKHRTLSNQSTIIICSNKEQNPKNQQVISYTLSQSIENIAPTDIAM